jgi:hypothetical protein
MITFADWLGERYTCSSNFWLHILRLRCRDERQNSVK